MNIEAAFLSGSKLIRDGVDQVFLVNPETHGDPVDLYERAVEGQYDDEKPFVLINVAALTFLEIT